MKADAIQIRAIKKALKDALAKAQAALNAGESAQYTKHKENVDLYQNWLETYA